MIKRYSEKRLTILCITIVTVLASVYILIGGLLWGLKDNGGYGCLPTFTLSNNLSPKHTFVSLMFFVVAVLIEGVSLAFFLD